MNSTPSANIIVLMSHYNDNERLIKSLESFKETIPVDLLIIDDGSTITPKEEELQQVFTVGKVTVVRMEKNSGCGKARNRGLEIISKSDYKYVGTMDSDDLNKENRFTKQFNYLENNEDVKLIGSWCDCINGKGEFLFTERYPVSYPEIKKKMYLNSMVAHPTMLFKRDILKTIGFFPEKYKIAEDYAFVFKVSKNFKIENYPEALIFYTINEKGYSSKFRKQQVKDRIRIIKDNFYFGFYPIYGLIRNIPLLFMSRNFLTFIKKQLGKN